MNTPSARGPQWRAAGPGHSWRLPDRALRVAVSAKWSGYPKRFRWLEEQGFALEYSLNPENPGQVREHTSRLLELGVPVRHHALFPGYELGHADAEVAARALRVHLAAIEALHGLGEQVITVHIGFYPTDPVNPDTARKHLAILVAHASALGITVCLENLRRGITSNPETVFAWAREAGAMITLDVGHAVSCQRTQSGELTVLDFIKMFAERLLEVHMYGREEDRHYPIRSEAEIAPVVDRLLATQCSWWTIELDDPDEALATREVLYKCAKAQR